VVAGIQIGIADVDNRRNRAAQRHEKTVALWKELEILILRMVNESIRRANLAQKELIVSKDSAGDIPGTFVARHGLLVEAH
jgi:hypothetical protein